MTYADHVLIRNLLHSMTGLGWESERIMAKKFRCGGGNRQPKRYFLLSPGVEFERGKIVYFIPLLESNPQTIHFEQNKSIPKVHITSIHYLEEESNARNRPIFGGFAYSPGFLSHASPANSIFTALP